MLAFILTLFMTASAQAGTGVCNTGDIVAYDGSALGCTVPQRQSKTVSTLPTCNSAARGVMYIVTDALAPVALATVAAGGAVVIGVTCNGTVWIVQ